MLDKQKRTTNMSSLRPPSILRVPPIGWKVDPDHKPDDRGLLLYLLALGDFASSIKFDEEPLCSGEVSNDQQYFTFYVTFYVTFCRLGS